MHAILWYVRFNVSSISGACAILAIISKAFPLAGSLPFRKEYSLSSKWGGIRQEPSWPNFLRKKVPPAHIYHTITWIPLSCASPQSTWFSLLFEVIDFFVAKREKSGVALTMSLRKWETIAVKRQDSRGIAIKTRRWQVSAYYCFSWDSPRSLSSQLYGGWY